MTPAGAALLAAVGDALPALEAMLAHHEPLGPRAVGEIEVAIAAMRDRLHREELAVVVVGEKKAGKSTFLNAVLGERVLGTAVRECTGTVTTIRHGDAPDYTARFRDGRTETFSQRAPEPPPEQEAAIAGARATLEALVAEGAHAHFPAEAPGGTLAFPDEAADWSAALEAADRLAAATEAVSRALAALPAELHDEAAAAPNWLAGARLQALKLAHGARLGDLAEARVARARAERRMVAAREAFFARRLKRLEAQREAHRAYLHHQFLEDLKALTDMDRRGAEVVALAVTYPGRHLPRGLAIIDTPGANTDHEANQARAWQAIREQADGCVLLSDLQQVMSRSTREFLQDVRQVVPHVILVLTKADRALENAMDGEETPEAQLEAARRIGVRRFALDMGRDPDEVLTLAVAAEPVLRAEALDSPEVLIFRAEVDRLFALLHHERALVLGARAGRALSDCVRRIEEASAEAESTYARRVAAMEAQRVQEPGAFRAQRAAAARPVVLERVVVAVEAAVQQFGIAVARLETRWTMKVLMAADKETLKTQLPAWADEHGAELDAAAVEAKDAVERRLGAVLHELLLTAHDELRERYRLAQGGNVTAAPLPLELPLPAADGQAWGIQANVAGAIASFESDAAALSAGGAAAGAVVGSMLMPGVGTAVGAALGSLAGRLFGLDMLKEDCNTQIKEGLAQAEKALAGRLREARVPYEQALLRRFDEALGLALDRFHAAIATLIARENQALDAARRDLESLVALRARLAAHEATIQRLTAEAVAESRGLAAIEPAGRV